jgi:hypothetical protein
MDDRRAPVTGYSVDAHFGLVHAGVLDEDDCVELLDGVIVAESPIDPLHAGGISLAHVRSDVRSAIARSYGSKRHSSRTRTPLRNPTSPSCRAAWKITSTGTRPRHCW